MSVTIRFFVCAAILVLCARSQAAVLHVPADFATIQQAVSAAGAADTVLVAPGVYQENVVILGKSITLASHYLLDLNPAHILNTVIDASQPSHPDTASAIILDRSTSGVVRGFTLTGGTGSRWFDVSDGNYYREGGGILTEGGAPTIRDNVIIGNRATNKSTTTSAGGGGLRSGFGTGAVVIVHNVFAYNDGLYGGGAVLFHNQASFRNSIVYENRGGQDFGGAGIWCASTVGSSLFVNNTLVGNHSALDGGGILVWNATANLINNIVYGNSSIGTGPQIRLRQGATATTVTYSDVDGGFAGTGNLNVDPLFDGSLFDLQGSSPCIDAGDPAIARRDHEDLGNPGMALPPSQGTVQSDMGSMGGPDAAPFPDWNSPQAHLLADTLDFDTVAVNSDSTLWTVLAKMQFGMVRVDSVQVTGSTSVSIESTVPLMLGPLGSGPLDSLALKWAPATYGPLQATALVYHSDLSAPSPLSTALVGHSPGKTGDTNFDGVITSADIIRLVNYVFKGGPPPLPVPRSGDTDCSGAITSADIIGLVNYVFKGGQPPCT